MLHKIILTTTAALFLAACAGSGSQNHEDSQDLPTPRDTGEDPLPSPVDILDIASDAILDTAPDAIPETVPDMAPDKTPDTEPLPPIEPAVCGLKPYEWLGPDQVGETLHWEESVMTNVTPEFIKETLGQAGYDKLEGIEHTVRNFKLRYTTQDKGAPIEATGMVGIPIDVEDAGPLPVLLWLHPTMGFSDACAPSADPLAGPGQTSILSSLGYITVAPDYIGMLGFGEPSPEGSIHPYLIAEPTALASLDAVRAALAYLAADPDLPDGDPNRIVLWGGSQGGHACFVTERYQPHYAPELDIVAVAAAIPVTDHLAQAEYGLLNWSDTTLGLAGTLVAMQAWYGIGDLTDILTDEEPGFIASTAPVVMAGGCSDGAIFDGVDSLEGIYTETIRKAAADGTLRDLDPWGCFLAESSVDRMQIPRISDAPFLATFGENDNLVQTSVELAAMARYCAEGYEIEYLNCAGLNHVQAGVSTLHYMHKWTTARLAGEDWPGAAICSSQEPVDCDILN